MGRPLSRTERLSKIKRLLERNCQSRTELLHDLELLHDFLSKLTEETKVKGYFPLGESARRADARGSVEKECK